MKGSPGKWWQQFHALFVIHKGERRGFLLLVVILFGALAWAFYQRRYGHTAKEDLEALVAEHQRWVELRSMQAPAAPARAQPFPFDPNTLDREGWRALGLTERQADAIARYRAKGGQFRSKQQLARFRGVPEATMARILPFATLPDSLPRGRDPRFARGLSPSSAPFTFDPNTLERAGWLSLGLTERQADAIARYRNNGGQFRSKQQFARFRTIPEATMARILPYALLPDSLPLGHLSDRTATPSDGTHARTPMLHAGSDERPKGGVAVPRKVEVNSTDSAALVALPGVGPVFAKAILAYREKLGGYRSLDQLAEVRVLQDKPDALERLRGLLVVDTLLVRRLDLNASTVEQLAAHPYVQWRLAKPIVALRTQHGPFRAVDDIRKSHLIDEAVFRKLAPYLTVE